MLLGVTGSVAAYRAPDVARLLMGRGCAVRFVLTRGGSRFVGDALLAGVSGEPTLASLWADGMAHIRADREADLVLVCPATAHLLARAALGLADDLLTTILLGTSNPVVIAPAMNVNMWEHPATKGHVDTLRERGVTVVEPESGVLACGEEGPGRLASVDEVVWAAGRALAPQDLAGTRVLVTAGPTREPLDAARHLSNPATGRMGAALAAAAWERGAETTLVAGPGTPPCPAGVTRLEATTAAQMDASVQSAPFDLALFAAAPADGAPREPAKGKMPKASLLEPGTLVLDPTLDSLARARESHPEAYLVGFAAVAGGPPEDGAAKVAAKGADAVLVNDITRADAGFAVATNHGHLFAGGEVVELGPDSKERFAHELLTSVLKVK